MSYIEQQIKKIYGILLNITDGTYMYGIVGIFNQFLILYDVYSTTLLKIKIIVHHIYYRTTVRVHAYISLSDAVYSSQSDTM